MCKYLNKKFAHFLRGDVGMKKKLSILLALIMMITTLGGCGISNQLGNQNGNQEGLNAPYQMKDVSDYLERK